MKEVQKKMNQEIINKQNLIIMNLSNTTKVILLLVVTFFTIFMASFLGSYSAMLINKSDIQVVTQEAKVELISVDEEPIYNAEDTVKLRYIRRFADTAKKEQEKFGIPVAIKLAQGLHESNSGQSRLAIEANNHFGIKCFSKKCSKGHCINFSDDSHKDFFKKYESAWESYRSHSKFLEKNRYKHLPKKCGNDYECWAYGLKKAGYATDKKYPQKIIGIIKRYKLDEI